MPRKRMLLLLSLLSLVKFSQEYGSGAPPLACLDQFPRHSDIPAQTSAPPYSIFTSPQVRQGDTLNVTIGSPFGAPTPIGGFILQARTIQDRDKIVGKFVRVPSDMAKISSCRGDNDTVTHTSPEDKPPLSFVWNAPADFLGGIEFRATVAQSYATFWTNVESSLVEVVTPDTVITTSSPPAPSQATTPPAPIMTQNTVKTTQAPLDTIYQGCADTKLCFGVPVNCIQSGNCKAVVAVFVAGDTYTFEIQGIDNPKYVSAGLSTNNKMGDDSAMECVRNDNGRVSLFTSWTYPKVEPYVRRSESPQDIVQLLESSVIDGKLYCKFRRDAVSTVNGQTFDLINEQYYLMVLSGSDMKDADRVGFHNLAYEASGAPYSLATVGAAAPASRLLIKLHGSFMITAWMGATSLGILLARYFKKTWVGKTLGGKDVWFGSHRILMMLTWVLTIIACILIVLEAGGIRMDSIHAITGIITVVLCFIQPIGAYFRPHPGTKRRALFNWIHWFVGNAAHILGIASIFLSVYLVKTDLPSWAVFIMAAYVIFHVITHIVLSLTVCVSEGRISNGRVNSFPMKDMMGQRQVTSVDRSADAPFSSFRKNLLGIYTPIILLFTVAMITLVALAPIAGYTGMVGT
nr:putative ferric-chelate reductase 1 homolog isoform X2 [Danaus plexippus plexippus]